jgi:multiple sugar transport system substrate-binding protein
MGIKWTKYFSLLVISGLFLSAASCGRAGTADPDSEPKPRLTQEPITLEYWRLFSESTAMDSFIEQYEHNHPNITIEVKKIDFKPGETIYDYQSNLIKLIADGAGPDMFMIHNSWLPYLINQVDPMPKGIMSLKEYEDTYPGVVVQDFVRDDRIYAAPYSVDNLMLYYNTDIFSAERLQPPKTLQDLVDIIPKLTKKDGAGRITRSAITLGADTASIPRAADILATFMMQYGAELTSPDNKTATFNLPTPNTNPPYFGGREALDYYTQFAKATSPNTYTYTDATDNRGNRLLPVDLQAFMEGKSAMFIGNGYHVQNILQFAPNRFHFETAPLPQLRLQDPVNLANYWGETVSKNSAHKVEAWDFINFMTSRQNLSYYARQTQTTPAHKDLLANVTGKRYYGPVAAQINYTRSWYRQNTPQIETIFSNMINSVVKNGVATDVAIDTAVRDINALNPSP